MQTQFARITSAQPHQLGGKLVQVEVDVARGMHAFSIIGLGDKAVDESRDRVGSALRHIDAPSPKHENEKTIVSLAPASLKKEGVYFDLAIALGYLEAKGELPANGLDQAVCIGELSLDGSIKPVQGMIALALATKSAGKQTMYVPADNYAEAELVNGLDIYGVNHLKDIVGHLKDNAPLPTPTKKTLRSSAKKTPRITCFSDIKGQEIAKRALLITASGGHNALMYGPPGTGKSMLAQAFAGILPPLSSEEALEVTSIHSIAGRTVTDLITTRPIESPHHTSSHTAILGGGADPRPGALTLAHHGVLFLDEFPEFDRRVLEGLRQPLEDRVVHIARAKSRATFPANNILLAAMNPPDPGASVADIRRLERKLSGPIMDRIDLWTNVEHVDYDTLDTNEPSGYTSNNLQQQVLSARQRQTNRAQTNPDWPSTNSQLGAKQINQLAIEPKAKTTLKTSAERLKLSPRGYHRVIKVAQTIADLDQSPVIRETHILEAVSYRSKKDAVTTPYQI